MGKHGRLLLPGDALMDPQHTHRQPLVVGRVELSRQMTHRDQPPVPGSRLGAVEARLLRLEQGLETGVPSGPDLRRIHDLERREVSFDERLRRVEDLVEAVLESLKKRPKPTKKRRT